MKKYLCIALLLVANVAYGQDNGGWTAPPPIPDSLRAIARAKQFHPIKYCLSYTDYKNGIWKEGEKARLVKAGTQPNSFTGSQDFGFDSDDKEYNKFLQKKVFAIEYENRLYVNARKLRTGITRFDSGYALAYPYDGEKLIIACLYRMTNIEIVISGGALGLIGGAMISNSRPQAKHTYLLASEKGIVTLFKEDLMKEVLANYPDELNQYLSIESKEERRNPETILYYLKKVGIIKEQKIEDSKSDREQSESINENKNATGAGE